MAADGLPKHCKRIATTQHSKNKNHTFAMQKPPFCTLKTPFLQRKNHTFAWRICNTQITNTLRTFRECILNELPKHIQHRHKNTTIVHHPTVTYFIKHTYSLTLIHIIYNIMHIFNCLREHLDNTKTAETYLNINLLKICKRLIFFTL